MPIDRTRVENGGLILFLAAITIGLTLVVADFLGALLWAALAASVAMVEDDRPRS